MTRLTNDIRNAIRQDLVEHRYGPVVKSIGDRLQEFAAKLYDKTYTPEQQVLMASLPRGWLPEVDHIRFAYAGQYHSIHFNGFSWGLSAMGSVTKRGNPINRLVATEHDRNYNISLRDEDLAREFGQIHNDMRKLEETTTRVQRDLETALAAFTTIEKLIEAWPEVEPFAKDYITAPQKASKTLLPAVKISSLNAMLDLPVEA